jgi:hypothetical protein
MATAIHAAWLMTPRDDLGGRTPRELLLERRRAIVWDLEDQALTWSKLGAAPPGLPLASAAYRYGGCGTHEVVLYYELLRHVLESARQWLYSEAGQPAADAAELAARLEEARRQWLDTPRVQGLTPLEVIELERRRIPLAVSGAEAMIDDDCPMCQMMADDLGPCFVNLDGCNMDDEFPFAFHLSRDEWEAERLEMEEFNRKFNAEWAARRAAEGDAASETWKESFSAADLAAGSPDLALLGIAAHLSELGLKLKELPAGQPWVESLNRHFGNLREAVGNPDGGLLEPVVERFCDELAAAAADHQALGEQCADLDRQVRQLAEAMASRTGEDLPF